MILIPINQTHGILSYIQQCASLFIIIVTKETRHTIKLLDENELKQNEPVIGSKYLMTWMTYPS